MGERPEKWYDERVEAWLDGDLPPGEARLFEGRLANDPNLQAAVEQARALSASLNELPRYRCPEDLARKVETITGMRRAGARRMRPRLWLGAAAAACAGLVAVGLALQPTEPDPSAREIAMARQELALALGYLDKAGQSAGRKVGEQFIEGLARPVEAGVAQTREETS